MFDENKIVYITFDEIMNFCKQHKTTLLAVSLSALGCFAFRKYLDGGVCTSNAKLHGKTVIITGGNTGIGKETAKDLAQRGARVILACRDLTKAERAAADIRKATNNNNVVVKVVDLASLHSIQRFCSEIKKSEDRLDILINNAGVMACPQWKSEDGYDLQFAVNHLGHFYLTNQLLDVLQKSSPSRVINVSSRSHSRGNINLEDINFENCLFQRWNAYSQSKLANVLFTLELKKRLQGSKVSVFSVHPGIVVTELSRHVFLDMPFYKKSLLRFFLAPLVCKSPKQGAQTTIFCSVSKGLEVHSGKYFSDCAVKAPALQAQDDETAVKLWDLSERMINNKLQST